MWTWITCSTVYDVMSDIMSWLQFPSFIHTQKRNPKTNLKVFVAVFLCLMSSALAALDILWNEFVSLWVSKSDRTSCEYSTTRCLLSYNTWLPTWCSYVLLFLGKNTVKLPVHYLGTNSLHLFVTWTVSQLLSVTSKLYYLLRRMM